MAGWTGSVERQHSCLLPFQFRSRTAIFVPMGRLSSSAGLQKNATHTAVACGGLRLHTGAYTHSLRFEYLRMRQRNGRHHGHSGGLGNPIPGLGMNIGASVAGSCVQRRRRVIAADQAGWDRKRTVQSNRNASMTAGESSGATSFRYGATFNRIQAEDRRTFGLSAGGYDQHLRDAGIRSFGLRHEQPIPLRIRRSSCSWATECGFSTAQAAFGYPGGGLGPDNRFEGYVGDTWKAGRD